MCDNFIFEWIQNPTCTPHYGCEHYNMEQGKKMPFIVLTWTMEKYVKWLRTDMDHLDDLLYTQTDHPCERNVSIVCQESAQRYIQEIWHILH